MKNFSRLLYSLYFILLFGELFSQCNCTDCPVATVNNAIVTSTINISGAANGFMGVNGQYLKSVHINMTTLGMDEYEIRLYSPGGNFVTLSTSNGFQNTPTFDFDICFVSCEQNPIPDNGFLEFFDSSSPYLPNVSYTGSYYPIQSLGPPFNSLGCLETLGGNVNGNWILWIEDQWPVTTGSNGTLLDWSLEFADNTGTTCIPNTCNVGPPICDLSYYTIIVPQPQVFCEGDPILDFSSNTNFGGTPPDLNLYGIIYLVVENNGTIVESSSNVPNMTSYPPDDYSLCVFQYLLADAALLPPLTVGSSYTNIPAEIANGDYCAWLECNAVNIVPDHPDVIMDWDATNDLCVGELYTFNMLNYDPSLTYQASINSGGFSQFTFSNGVLEIAAIIGPLNLCISVNDDCFSIPVCKTFNVIPGLELPILDAPVAECVGNSFQVDILNNPLAPQYNWTISGPGTIDQDNNSNIIVSTSGSGTITICANASSPSCGSTTDVCINVIISDPPAPTILADPEYCLPGGFIVGNANGSASSTTYTQISGPGTIVFTNPNVVSTAFTVDIAGTYSILLTKILNGCEVTTTASFEVLEGLPIVNLDGPIQVCAGSSFQIDVTNTNPAPNHTWTVTGPGTITTDNGTNVIITTDPNAGAEVVLVCVTPSSPECGDGVESCFGVFVLFNTLSPPTLNDFNLICIENPFLVFVQDNPLASFYNWTVTGPATFIENSEEEIEVTPTGLGIITICATAEEPGCGVSAPTCFDVEVIDPAPPTINASPIICIPGGIVSGVLNDPTNSVTWEVVSGPGSFVFSNPFTLTTAYTVDTEGTYEISLTENNLGCVRTALFTIQVDAELSITPTVTCNGSDFTIEIIFNNGTPPYSVFGSPISGNIYTSPPYPAGSAVLTLYSDGNGCEGQYFVQEFCACITDAGTMNITPIEICNLNDPVTGIHNNDATFDANDIGVYILHDSPTNNLGAILQQNTSGIFNFAPPMIAGQTYYISYVVGNDAGGTVDLTDLCTSVSIGQPVRWNEEITISINQVIDPITCDFNIEVEAVLTPNVTNVTGVWSLINGPAGGTAAFNNPTALSTALNLNLPGIYTIAFEALSNGCSFIGDYTFEIISPLTLVSESFDCDANGDIYNVTLVLESGSPIEVNGDIYNPPFYTSGNINSGDNYVFNITDDNGCVLDLNGSVTCSCVTFAGTMDQTILNLCENDIAGAFHFGDEILDGDDAFVFYLHDGSTNNLGTIFDENSTGVFAYNTNLVLGQIYYISFVAGNTLGSGIDLTDPCLSVSVGQPVVWYQNPAIDPLLDIESCNNSTNLTASVDIGTSYLWSILNGPIGNTAFISSPTSLSTTIISDTPGNYEIVFQATNQVCSSLDTLVVTFFPPITIENLQENCQGQTYNVSFDILSGNPPYIVSGNLVTGNTFTSQVINSGEGYNFVIQDNNGCSIGIQGSKNCNCTSDAGTMNINELIGCGENDTLTAQHNNNAFFDGDDTGVYILHSAAGVQLGTIYDQNTTGQFSLQAGMFFDTIYYVSFVVGNSIGTGVVDLSDPCLDVAPGTPLLWISSPISLIKDNYFTCKDTFLLSFDSIAQGTFSIEFDSIPDKSSIFIDSMNRNVGFITDTSGLFNFHFILKNGLCATSDTIELTNQKLTVNAGLDQNICGLASSLNGFIEGSFTTNSWNLAVPFPGSTISIDDIDLVSNISVDLYGTYFLELQATNDNCSANDTVALIFQEELSIIAIEEICNANGNTYTIGFNIEGGNAPYFVNGNTIVGNTFLSNDIISGESYIFTISDSGFCSDAIVNGQFDCGCLNKSGDLPTDQLSLCENDSVIVNYILAPISPAGYVNAIALHDGTPFVLGTIYGIFMGNSIVYDPSFPLDQNLLLTPVSVFEVSPGVIDLNDICLDIGQSQPIIWKSDIKIILDAPTAPICEDETFRFDIRVVSSVYPVSVEVIANGYNETIIITSGNQAYTYEVGPGILGLFTFTIDGACIDPTSNTNFTIVRENCDCETYSFSPIDSLCIGVDNINLDDWKNQQIDGVWSIVSSNMSTPPLLNGSTLNVITASTGDLVLSFVPTGIESCDTTYLFNLFLENYTPINEVVNVLRFCPNSTSIINLNDYLSSSPLSGTWQSIPDIGNNLTQDGTIDISNLNSGGYVFSLENMDLPLVCVQDRVGVAVIKSEAPDYVITSNNPDCFGEEGSLNIEIMGNTTEITSILLNESEFTFPYLQELAPGNYEIQINDENFCSYLESVTIIEPNEIIVSIDSTSIKTSDGNLYQLNLQSNVDFDNVQILWFQNEVELGNENDDILTINLLESTTISVLIIDKNGCSAEDLIVINIVKEELPDVVLPNVFNPKSTNGNRLFYIPSFEKIKRVDAFSIFDRWGNVVFSAKEFNPETTVVGWDGTMNGRECEAGVYIYRLAYYNLNDQLETLSSDITLIR